MRQHDILLAMLRGVSGVGRAVWLRRQLAGLALVLLTAWTVSAASPGEGAPAGSLSIAEALKQALTEGSAARIARLEAGRADDARSKALSAYLPHVAVSSEAGYSNRQDEKLVALDGSGRVRQYGLATIGSNQGWFNVYVDQLVFDLESWHKIEHSEISADIAHITEAEQRETISFAVLQRYTDVLRLEEIVALETEQTERARWLDEQGALLLKAGRAVRVDRDQVALHLEGRRLAVDRERATLSDARRTLWRTIAGKERGTVLQLVPASLPVIAPNDGHPAEDNMVSGAPDMRIVALRTRLEEMGLAAARAERYPTLGLRAGYSNYGAFRFDNFPDELYVAVQFELPVFDGFDAKSSIKSASKSMEIARLRQRAMQEEKRARLRELQRQLGAAARDVDLAGRRAEAARERLRLADLRLQGRRGTLVQAVAAHEEAAAASRLAIEKRYERIVLWATLQREMGRLTGKILGPAMTKAETP
jgi:outer membrane protein